MLVLTWNMGHRGPSIRRGDPAHQWALVAERAPVVIFAQEAPSPEMAHFDGYDIAFAPVSARHIGTVVAVRKSEGALELPPASTDRDDLGVWSDISGTGRTLLVSTQTGGRRNPNHALDRALSLAGDHPLLVAGDFGAGPSTGDHNPCAYAPTVGLTELSTSTPETNTIRRARQTTDVQVDHVFGRGFASRGATQVLPVADDPGSIWSYHNAVLVELEASP